MCLNAGTKFKCYLPSKLNTNYNLSQSLTNKFEVIPNHIIGQLMRLPARMCYNTNLKEWFYKVCPFKSSQQILIYKKTDEKGKEYTEKFMLGFAQNFTNLSHYELFLNDNSTDLNKLELKNLSVDPLVFVEKDLAKILNFNLDVLKDYECTLILFYNTSAFDLNLHKDLPVNKYQTLSQYLKDYPDAETIPFQRAIVRQVGRNLVILDSSFPFPNSNNTVNINPLKEKGVKEVEQASNLYLHRDLIYCQKCEFLLYYSPGDTIFLKNPKLVDSQRNEFRGIPYQGRVITEIINNHLLRVSKPFDKVFGSSVARPSYFVLDSFKKQYTWSSGKGYITVFKNLIFGFKTNFLFDVKEGDHIFLVNPQRNSAYIHHTSTNPKFNDPNYCIIKQVINRHLLLTEKSCVVPHDFKGVYFVSASFNNYDNKFYKIKALSFENNDLTNEENKELIRKTRNNLLIPRFSLKDIKSESKEEKESGSDVILNQDLKHTMVSLVDFHTFEDISFSRISNVFYTGPYITHRGLILKRPSNSVLRMRASKMQSGAGAYLRIILSTKIENFHSNTVNEDTDYELIIHSENGLAVKKINNLTTAQEDTFQFLDLDVRTFFVESIDLEIIFLNNTIYLSSNDDDYEFSVKVHLKIDTPIRFISFDSQRSNNIDLKNIKLINFVEATSIYSIYVFENRMKLGPNSTYTENQTNGDYCDDIGGNRSTIIEYSCDKSGNHDVLIDKVEEIDTCKYKYYLKTKHLCNPYELMTNKIMNSIARTKCFVTNNFHNRKSHELFSKLI